MTCLVYPPTCVFTCLPLRLTSPDLNNTPPPGLASSGAWGCFDEFNRLVPEVLSVCSLQFKAVTDGLKAHALARAGRDREDHLLPSIVIEDDKVNLDPGCGVFITMNPGYLGRSELPEGLKVISCRCVMELIGQQIDWCLH